MATNSPPPRKKSKPNQDYVQNPPPCGVLHHGKVLVASKAAFVSRPPLGKHMVNEGLKSDRVKETNYPTWETKGIQYWATPRLSGSGACRVLTNRGAGDLSNQLRFESEYVQRYPDESKRGIVVNPVFTEWMQGLPRNWTSTESSPQEPSCKSNGGRIVALDLFTGCGGLTLGLHPWVQSVGYCEFHVRYSEILSARIKSQHLDNATIFPDVKTLTKSDLAKDPTISALPNGVDSIDLICAGFPCQNISNAGDQRGFQGEKSSLFYEVRRLIQELRPRHVFLENVSAITCASMSPVLSTVVTSLDKEGYDAQWGVFEARHAGAPHRRKRWFLFATRRDVDVEALRANVPPLSSAEQASMAQQWPPSPSLDERLLPCASKDTRIRLETMGNMVCVPQAALAFRFLVHGGFVE